MHKFYNTNRNILVVLAVLCAFLFGIFVGDNNRPAIDKVLLSNKDTQVTTTADFGPFWKAWNAINDKSLEGNKISDQDKVYGAISGLVGSLNDPYSVFFSPAEAKSFEDEIAGNFDGIGLEVGIKNKILTVIAPIKDTPAYKAGMKSGDKILKIDKAITSNMSADEAIKLIRGPKGTTVTLTILRNDEDSTREVKIVRDNINIPTLDTEVRPDGIFVIKLYSFSANSASLFRDAMKKFVASGSDKLILDLRDNPGGYLDSAVDISSWFLKSGQTVVTENYGDKKKADVLRSKGYNIFNDKLKFIIIINGGSASASEIVAGALRDNGVAKLVGSQSYGKGSVQEVVDITPDTILKITVAKWFTPNGVSISEKGLTPDYVVEYQKKSYDDKADPVMDKAVQLLLTPTN